MPAHIGPLGIDLAADTSDVVDQLRGSGVDFVARYYRDPTSSLPALSPSEAQKLSSLGLNIVAVWEQNSPDPENVLIQSGMTTPLQHTGKQEPLANRLAARSILPSTLTRMT